jgi:DtxR family Mn-dependent transcriptional regulator
VAPDTKLLREVAVGDEFTISRIPEELEFEPGMLDFLEAHSLQPGHTGVLTVLSPDGTATVEMDGAHVGVPAFASQRILVTL